MSSSSPRACADTTLASAHLPSVQEGVWPRDTRLSLRSPGGCSGELDLQERSQARSAVAVWKKGRHRLCATLLSYQLEAPLWASQQRWQLGVKGGRQGLLTPSRLYVYWTWWWKKCWHGGCIWKGVMQGENPSSATTTIHKLQVNVFLEALV